MTVSRVRDALPPLIVFTLVLAAWYAASSLLLDEDRRFLLPPPHQVVIVGLLDWTNLREILGALLITTFVALTGLAIAIVVGMAFAIVMHQARWIERSFYPYAVVLQTIPILALRFSEDKICPREKFATIRQVFGDTPEVIEDSTELCWRRGEALETIEINSRPGNPYNISPNSHAILTVGFREEGHPVHRVYERVIEFLKEQLPQIREDPAR
jgi:hypothetical protein